MLQLMRKHARSWFIQVLLFIIIIVFVLYFGSMRGRRQAESLAIVKDKAIGYAEFKDEYQNLLEYYRARYKGTLTDELLKALNLKQRALDNIINQAVILAKADELNLGVSDEEVRSSIYAYPAFQRDGVFDVNLYERMLRYNRMTPEDFEAMQKRVLKIGKLERLIKEGIKVSDQEAYDIYRIQNERVSVRYIALPTSTFAATVKPTEDDLNDYLKEHGEEFRVPAKVQVKYIAFLAKNFVDATEISEKDIEEYYYDHQNEFAKSDKMTHPLSEVKDKILTKLQLIKGLNRAATAARQANDIIYQEENFEEYAEEHNYAIKTTEFFTRTALPEEMNGINDFEKYVFEMKEGETAPLLSSEEGFYIVKVNAIRPSYIPQLEEARKKINKKYVQEKSKTLCAEKAGKVLDRLRKGGNFDKVAREEGLTVKETGLFLPGPNIPELGTSMELAQALFLLSAKAPYPDVPYYLNDKYVIVKFKERGKLDPTDFEKQKGDLKNYLLTFKGNEHFRLWLETIKASMIKDGTLKITADLDRL